MTVSLLLEESQLAREVANVEDGHQEERRAENDDENGPGRLQDVDSLLNGVLVLFGVCVVYDGSTASDQEQYARAVVLTDELLTKHCR